MWKTLLENMNTMAEFNYTINAVNKCIEDYLPGFEIVEVGHVGGVANNVTQFTLVKQLEIDKSLCNNEQEYGKKISETIIKAITETKLFGIEMTKALKASNEEIFRLKGQNMALQKRALETEQYAQYYKMQYKLTHGKEL